MATWDDVVEIAARLPGCEVSSSYDDGWPVVLVNLDTVTPEQLFELIEDAWRVQAPKRAIAAYDAGG